jgi:hypothetical protein
VRFVGQKFLDLFREMPFGTPHEANHSENHKHGDESQPERLLQHTLGQRLVRNVHHPFLASVSFPPGVASADEAAIFLEALASTFTRVFRTGSLFLITMRAKVSGLAVTLKVDGQRQLHNLFFNFSLTLKLFWVSSHFPNRQGSSSHMFKAQNRPV